MRKWLPALSVLLALAAIYLYWVGNRPADFSSPSVPEAAGPGLALLLIELHSSDSVAREEAARALGRAARGRDGQPANSELMHALLDALRTERNRRVRSVIAWSLGQAGPGGAAVLLEALREIDRTRVQRALAIFGAPGPARAAIPGSLLFAQLGDLQFTQAVGFCLAQGGKENVPHLKDALAAPQGGAGRAGAALALGILGPDASQAVDWLRPLLAAEEDLVASQVCLGLALLGRPGVSALRDSLRDPNSVVRAHAALGLNVQLDEDATEFFSDPAALAARERAARPERRTAVPDLKRVLGDSDPYVRLYAVLALLRIDPDSNDEVRPTLRELVKQTDPQVRQQAMGIVRRLER